MDYKRNDDKVYKKEEALTLQHCIEYLFILLGYARIWPTESVLLRKILFSTGMTIIFLLGNFLLLFSEIIALALYSDMQLFANIIGVICMHATGLVKWCYCIIKNQEILYIMAKLDRCHTLCQQIDNGKNGRRIYRKTINYIRRYSNFFTCWWMLTCIYGVLHWCLNPLVVELFSSELKRDLINHTLTKRSLPFIGWYPCNLYNIYNYICVYLLQTTGAISSAIGIVCYDAFYVSMLINVCAQFQYINTILTVIDSNNIHTSEAMFLEQKLKNCVQYHVEIIKFLKMLQNFTSPTMFVQCIETLVIICLVSFEASALKITINMESILKLWSLIEYFLCASIQLYFFCFYASNIQHLALQVANSVYSCGWELTTSEEKEQPNLNKHLKRSNVERLVQTIIIQAQRPIVLTGGPFYVLSLETFKVIISAAISNAVVLRKISDQD